MYLLSLVVTVLFASLYLLTSILVPFEPFYIPVLLALGAVFVCSVALANANNPLLTTTFGSAVTLVVALLGSWFFLFLAALTSDPFVGGRLTELPPYLAPLVLTGLASFVAAVLFCHLFLAALVSLLGRAFKVPRGKLRGRR